MRRFLLLLLVLAVIGGVVFYVLTIPKTIAAADLPKHAPDLKNGEYMFHAGGCASCHATRPAADCDAARAQDKMQLGGGHCLKTPFGTFNVPNISPDRDTGIGGWSDIEFINAMMRGVSPAGSHLYPAFPYVSYQRMRMEDVLDLKAFIDTLPAVKSTVPGHDLALPFRFRRGLGLWKLLFLDGKPFSPIPGASAEVNRGAYLVNGPGHCGECHTPRDLIGGMERDHWLAGGPAPEGKGRIPNITPDKDGIGAWSAKDIAYSLESGFTPEFDAFGGSMVAVQENMAKLTAEDRAAIAAYLKSIPAVANPPATNR